MKKNATKTSALAVRISLQENQAVDLNEWIFNKVRIDSDPKILELCCGTGAQTEFLVNIMGNGSLDCVDINSGTIRENFSSVKNKTINYHVSSIDDINSYAPKEVDLIFSAYGFYYSDNPINLHEELKKILSKKGKFILVGPVLGNNAQLYEIMAKIGVEISSDVLFSSEEFMLKMEEIFLNSYNNVKFDRVLNRVNFSSANDLLKYWQNTTFYDADKEEDFLSAVNDFYNDDIFITKSISYLEGYA
jgi:ubiquinone/menaquinone biosynthesis C-methylase UbiE